RRGEELDPAALLEGPERAGDILVPVVEQARPGAGQAMEVELCAAMPERLRSRPAFLPLTQLHERVQVYDVAVAQEPVGEHGEERRTDRHREDHVEAVAVESLQDVADC